MAIQQMFLGIPAPSSGGGNTDIENNGLVAYWNAISENVENQGSASKILDTSGNGNDLQSSNSSMTWESSDGGRVNVPSGGTNFFEWANTLTFNGGTAFTYFWCGLKTVTTYSWWMLATNNDGDNFIGVYADYLHRLDSNNNIKGDLSLSNISYATNTIHCFYMTMETNGNITWYHNGSNIGSVTFGDGTNVWAADSAVFKYINRYGSESLQSSGRFHFSGFYDRALSSSEVSSNWSAHQTRLGI
tara:strand:+ start:273 stop:1007 length:735 start_codon:yes stop_codon:yes gene_type:complete